ncbi:10248_t:CDS:2 [Funneliformis geosporum]|nr:10248_t:CDS:2 [Funneliformis geosporum]
MTRNAQEYIERIINKEKQFTLNLKDQKLSGEMDLNQFTSLVSIQASNKIEKVDFVRLLNDFPKLESINLENNPLDGNNLDSLNNQQFSQLVEDYKFKKYYPLMDEVEQLKKEAEENNSLNSKLKEELKENMSRIKDLETELEEADGIIDSHEEALMKAKE